MVGVWAWKNKLLKFLKRLEKLIVIWLQSDNIYNLQNST